MRLETGNKGLGVMERHLRAPSSISSLPSSTAPPPPPPHFCSLLTSLSTYSPILIPHWSNSLPAYPGLLQNVNIVLANSF